MNDSVNIIGAGQNSTIIQAGTIAYNAGTPNGVDMLMAVNEDLPTFTNATASISNLTLQNGHNRGTVAGTDGDAGCLEFDTGLSGTNTLTLTNVTIQNCDTTDGNGGGIAGFNTQNGTGQVTITNSIVQGNQAVQGGGTGTGGGVWVSDPSRMSLTSVQVLNNKTPSTNNTNQAGSGGGITTTSNSSNSRQTVIHSSTISGNQSAGEGGGIKASTNLLIDTGTVISNNSAGSASVLNKTDGGGIFENVASIDSVILNKVAITGNSAPHGKGGVFLPETPATPAERSSWALADWRGTLQAFQEATWKMPAAQLRPPPARTPTADRTGGGPTCPAAPFIREQEPPHSIRLSCSRTMQARRRSVLTRAARSRAT